MLGKTVTRVKDLHNSFPPSRRRGLATPAADRPLTLARSRSGADKQPRPWPAPRRAIIPPPTSCDVRLAHLDGAGTTRPDASTDELRDCRRRACSSHGSGSRIGSERSPHERLADLCGAHNRSPPPLPRGVTTRSFLKDESQELLAELGSLLLGEQVQVSGRSLRLVDPCTRERLVGVGSHTAAAARERIRRVRYSWQRARRRAGRPLGMTAAVATRRICPKADFRRGR